MDFRTELDLLPQEPKIGLDTQMLSIGSCFADNIGKKLGQHKFNIQHNPFGVLFNLISITKLLEHAASSTPPAAEHFAQQHGIWKHFDFHSKFSFTKKEVLVENIHATLEDVRNKLKNLDLLIITLGTAWVHELHETQSIIANCHKFPRNLFNKRLLQLEELHQSFDTLLSLLPNKTHIILTVSPIRHIKEGLPLNQVSKSLLRVFCHQVSETHQRVSYFPSYELVLDDLRDYRFYKDDMIHPSDAAIEYIWKKFSQAYFNEDSIQFVEKWKKLNAALNHRPAMPNSNAHQLFLKGLLKKLEEIAQTVDVQAEIEHVKAQIQD